MFLDLCEEKIPGEGRFSVYLSPEERVPWLRPVQQESRPVAEWYIAEKFFAQVLKQACADDLLSDEHISGTLIEAWASQKSFHRKDQGPTPPPEDPAIRPSIFAAQSVTTTPMLQD
jgi:hypothetical protein